MAKDYTKYSFRITGLVIVTLLVISFIPGFSVGDLTVKRANIISELWDFGDGESRGKEAKLSAEDEELLKEAERLAGAKHDPGDPVRGAETAVTADPWLPGTAVAHYTGEEPLAELVGSEYEGVTRLIDYTDPQGRTLAKFCSLLGEATKKRSVRIAFLGDSYIEGDIITADVRDQLQSAYGGGGVGFVPFMTPLAPQRPTVKHTFGEWTNYTLAQRKNAPEELQDKFFISGILSIPGEQEAWAEYRTAGFRRNLSRANSAHILFMNRASSGLEVVINDSIVENYRPETSDAVQKIDICGTNIKSLKVSIENPEGFIGYGVMLDAATGVALDNYSIRSNSGVALFGSARSINTALGGMLGYDLIVLQYGLNAMSPEATDYANYGVAMRKVIKYVRACFPRAAIIVMGVGDRSTLEGGEFVTMPGIYSMIKEQQAAARDCGVAFWNTFQAMGGPNSMAAFVEKNWAAKDYTHLSYSGGRFIATEFVRALRYHKAATESLAKMSETPSEQTAQETGADSGRVDTGATFAPGTQKSEPRRASDTLRSADTLRPDSLQFINWQP